MSYNVESVIRHMINQNNHNMNIAFPAVVVGVDKLKDGLLDVQPVVDYINPLTRKSEPYPVLHDISVMFPSTQNSTIAFPLVQGDFVDLLVQSVDIQSYVNGSGNQHSPNFLSHGNLTNVVAMVGFTPYQNSPFNISNYSGSIDSDSLNIVHNKGSEGEVSISLNIKGDVLIKSPTRVVVECKEVDVIAEEINANNAVINTGGDVIIGGRSVKQFMIQHDLHTHIDSQGSPTTPPVKA